MVRHGGIPPGGGHCQTLLFVFVSKKYHLLLLLDHTHIQPCGKFTLGLGVGSVEFVCVGDIGGGGACCGTEPGGLFILIVGCTASALGGFGGGCGLVPGGGGRALFLLFTIGEDGRRLASAASLFVSEGGGGGLFPLPLATIGGGGWRCFPSLVINFPGFGGAGRCCFPVDGGGGRGCFASLDLTSEVDGGGGFLFEGGGGGGCFRFAGGEVGDSGLDGTSSDRSKDFVRAREAGGGGVEEDIGADDEVASSDEVPSTWWFVGLLGFGSMSARFRFVRGTSLGKDEGDRPELSSFEFFRGVEIEKAAASPSPSTEKASCGGDPNGVLSMVS